METRLLSLKILVSRCMLGGRVSAGCDLGAGCVAESHAYQELEGALSSSPDLMSRELGSLQLDNVAEFPPVGHKTA